MQSLLAICQEHVEKMGHYVDINGVRLHYTVTGNPEGSPVIIMHGWGCNISTVASIAKALEDTRKVICIDLPGHGESTEPPLMADGKPWGVVEYADAVENLIQYLNLENPSLIGHSYGGRVAIVLGSRRDIEKIVLVDSAGVKPKRKLSYFWKVYSFKAMKRLLPFFVGKSKAAEIIDRRRQKAGSADYRQASPVMRMVMSRSVNQDLRHLMPSIKAPTLLIWGENDTATPLSDAKIMERLIPDAGLVSFKGAGHYSFLDNPGQFKAVIKSFLP